MSLLLVVIVAVLFTSEVQTLWGAGFLPGNNQDEPSSFQHGKDDASRIVPPKARREEDRQVQVGVAPPDWDPDLPRQSQESTSPLVDPPRMVQDPYGWMRDDDRSNPEILDHLHAENNYTRDRLKYLTPLQTTLYQELLRYTVETSHSFPSRDRSYYYYQRTLQGKSYPLHCRAPIPDDDDVAANSGTYLQQYLQAWNGEADSPILPGEHVFLDENVEAQTHEFFATGALKISPSETLLAYMVDTVGNELYQLQIMNIETGEMILGGDNDNSILMVEDVAWGLDDDTQFYTQVDDTQRPYQVYQHQLSDNIKSILLYEEPDVTYWVGMTVTMDQQYLLMESASTESSEFHYLDLHDGDNATVKCFSKRRPLVIYEIEHVRGYWWILSNINDADGDFQLFTIPVGFDDSEQWTRVMDPSGQKPLLEGIAIEDFTVFRHHIVVQGRSEGIMGVWIVKVDEEDSSHVVNVERVEFTDEPAHTANLAANDEYNTTQIIVSYESMVTPQQKVQVDLDHPNSDKRLVVYEIPVPHYDKSLYACQRHNILSRDGKTQIPVSMVYRKSIWNDGQDIPEPWPLHLYAYGAYGSSMNDAFSTSRLPLLDREVIFAVAHVRGGGELGRKWYTDGKLLNKHNTFDDFVDVAQYYIREGWTSPGLLSCEGRSAGGLTMGASLNQAPDLFRAAILGVPFVDLIVTMMDASIPLTSGEWREWGNPNEEDYFEAMMAYSPMNNVQAATYPSMLLLAGLFDPRVAYWEPAKLTATLRHIAIPDEQRPICLKTDMNSGHFSASDRYKNLEARSFEYAFILDQLGVE